MTHGIDASLGEPLEGPPARLGLGSLIQIGGDAFVAVTALVLSLGGSDDAFANSFWRLALAATGALFAFIALRALVRTLQGYRPRLDKQSRKRAKWRGKLFALLGLWLLALAVISPLGEDMIELETWHKIGYGLVGALNLLIGLLVQWDPTRHIQAERVRKGDGIRGRARILRANDTGTTVNDAPQVKIDFTIEVEGRDPYESSDKIVMQRAKLALLIPGSSLGVTVDRVNPNVFHLDWDDWKPPPG